MKRTVSTIFNTHIEANKAMTRLLAAGFGEKDISLVMSHDTRTHYYPEDATAESMGWAAGLGAIAGSLIGIAAAPPFGLVVAGPLVGMLGGAVGGAAVGAASGGLVGALVETGLPEERAMEYEQRLGGGGILVAVQVDTKEDAENAERILETTGLPAAPPHEVRITPHLSA